MGCVMAHGKHRRVAKLTGRRDLKLFLAKEKRSESRAEDRDPLHQADVPTDTAFSLMACEHPGQCACDTDYPNWRPGLR